MTRPTTAIEAAGGPLVARLLEPLAAIFGMLMAHMELHPEGYENESGQLLKAQVRIAIAAHRTLHQASSAGAGDPNRRRP